MKGEIEVYLNLVRKRKNRFALVFGNNNFELKTFILRIKIKPTDEDLPHIKVEPVVGRIETAIYFPERMLTNIESKLCSSGDCPAVGIEFTAIVIENHNGELKGRLEKIQKFVLIDEIILHELVHLMWGHDAYGPLLKSVKYPRLLEIAVEYQTHRTVALFAKNRVFQKHFFSMGDIDLDNNGYILFVREFAPEFEKKPLDSWTPLDLYEVLESNVPESIKLLLESTKGLQGGDDGEGKGGEKGKSEGMDESGTQGIIYLPAKSGWRIGVEGMQQTLQEVEGLPGYNIFGEKSRSKMALGPFRQFDSVENIINRILGSEQYKEIQIPWYMQFLYKVQNKHSRVNWLDPDPTTLWNYRIYIPTWEDRKVDVIVLIDTSGSMDKDEIIDGLKFLASTDKIRFVGLYMHTVECYYQLYNDTGIDVETIAEEIISNSREGGTDYVDAYETIIKDMAGNEIIMHITDGICNIFIPEELFQRLIYVFTEKNNWHIKDSKFNEFVDLGLVSYVIIKNTFESS